MKLQANVVFWKFIQYSHISIKATLRQLQMIYIIEVVGNY